MSACVDGPARAEPEAGSPAKLRARPSRRRWLAVAVALAAGAAASASILDVPLVVTQVPARAATPPKAWNADALVRADWFDGARLVVVAPSGAVRVLSEGFAAACDPNLSFDGRKILFAGRREPGAPWRIWEIGIDGRDLRAITPETLEARSPIHVSELFTLNSPQPWSTLVFVGRETGAPESATSLYDIKLDGGELRRLTFGPLPALDPAQMWDGRVIYIAGREPAEPSAAGRRLGLSAIHLEGADREIYGGELGLRVQQMPCATAGGLVVFVESDAAAWDGAGRLACVEQQRPHVTHRLLKQDRGRRYLYPSPLEKNDVLVAQRSAAGKDTWAIVRFDADTGAVEPVFDSREYHDVQAVALLPRTAPDGHSTVVVTDADYGTFYGLDCYTTDAARAGQLRPGEVKRVRLIEGVATSGATAPFAALPRRLVGEAPVEADGSFNVVVPADTPLLLQTLDESGMALGTCGWIWVKPKELRGCIGCHEDPERVPENNYVLALHRASDRLTPPAAERRRVTFVQDVAPILARHGTAAALQLALGTPAGLRAAHRALTQGADRVVEPGRARTSRLVWQLAGRNTSRPWDAAARERFTPPAAGGSPLSADELRTVVLWIDLGAAFDAADAAPAPTGKENAGK